MRLTMFAVVAFVCFVFTHSAASHDNSKITYETSLQQSMRLGVRYSVAVTCNATRGLQGWREFLLPCGPTARLYVVIAPCPALPRDPLCWDPFSDRSNDKQTLITVTPTGENRSSNASNPTDCPVHGVCLSTVQDTRGRIFLTDAFQLPSESQPGQYFIASVYFHIEKSSDGWTMQKDLATHVPFSAAGRKPVILTPYFSALAEGKLFSVPDFAVPEFGGHHKLHVYIPPACAENLVACAAAKIIIVTDGDWWFETPELARQIKARADSIIMERRASPFILVGVPQAVTFSNGSAWNCSRTAMYTPGPCPEIWAASPYCKQTCWGQADFFLTYLTRRVLPWVHATYSRTGAGQKAAIAGFSLGGLVSCYAAWARPDVFDAATCSSPSFWYPQVDICTGDATSTLNRTFFAKVAMSQYRPPLDSRIYVSDGTSEDCSMGGTAAVPGPIPLTVQAMKDVGMNALSFEQNEGFRHDPLMGWILDTFWRSLETIAPYTQTNVRQVLV